MLSRTIAHCGEGPMAFHLDIPDSIAQSLRLPAPEVVPRLRTELAVALYAQGILSFGKASELAELTRFAFAELVTQRGIPRHYTEDELTQDLDYAGRQ
jgi:predicted HTH domain antitoxin